MSKFLIMVLLIATIVVSASVVQAQTVAMYGEYHESVGIIVNIPQNPPIVPCVPPPLPVAPPPHATIMGMQMFQNLAVRPTGVDDARCHARGQYLNFNVTVPNVFNQPRVGARGARNVEQPAGVLDVGNPFTIPPFAFNQQLGPQVGQILKSVTRQLDTTFILAMPATNRNGPFPGPLPGKGGTTMGGQYTLKSVLQLAPIPPLTRMFSQMNWQNPGNGWDNGLAPGGVGGRTAANQVVTQMVTGAGPWPNNRERVLVRYVAGPRQFGGTMALLLGGKGRLYLRPPAYNTPAALRPLAGTLPLPNNDPGFRRRGGIGWNLTIPGSQAPGKVKAFQGNLLTEMGLKPIIAPDCTVSTDPLNLLPVGCNLVNGFDTYMRGFAGIPSGGTIGQIPKATSIRHVFGFTTGTVSIVVVASRRGTHFSVTLTGMGYDTVGLSSMGGRERNVGLVAGSYTVRTSTTTEINTQMLGINLKFSPEPGATAALVSGLVALGLFGVRRRAIR